MEILDRDSVQLNDRGVAVLIWSYDPVSLSQVNMFAMALEKHQQMQSKYQFQFQPQYKSPITISRDIDVYIVFHIVFSTYVICSKFQGCNPISLAKMILPRWLPGTPQKTRSRDLLSPTRSTRSTRSVCPSTNHGCSR